jgi:hypothetical protein
MNNALALETFGLSLNDERPLEGLLSFLAPRSRRSARELSESTVEVFNGVAGVVERLLMNVIEKRTAAEFDAAFTEAFQKYVVVTLASSRFAQAMVPPDVVDRLTRESICELETDFRDKALLAFGAAARDQALFTIWTLRKVNELVTQICAVKVDQSKQKEDKEYSYQFNVSALRAQFCLDSLNLALRINRPIYPEVMQELIEGLRAMVNAYTWARRGFELRFPATEQPLELTGADAEDEELLRASMHDWAAMVEDERATNGD